MRFLLAFLLASSSLFAQNVALSEDFSGTTFPPPGWSEVRLQANNGWKRQASTQRAWHEDFTGGTTENYLISPPLDLSNFTQAYFHFEGETNFATYLANHPNSVGDGVSNIEITTDGGVNWTTLWTDTSQTSGDTYGPTLDLSAYAGMTNVQVAFYFYGTYAQEWWVDNAIVDDVPVPVLATATNPSNGHPYFLLGQSDFNTAQAMALSLGGNLASVSDSSENNWIKSTFGNFGGTTHELMIGLTDRVQEGVFEWISGEAFSYANWAAGEPNNNGNEDYVKITSNGQWNDFNDAGGAYGVVEISQPMLSSTPLLAGQLATITVNGLRTDSTVVFVFSTQGAGPTNTPYGVMNVDPDMISPVFPSMNGQFNFSTYIPSFLSGATLYGQAVQFNADSTTDLSDPMANPIQ